MKSASIFLPALLLAVANADASCPAACSGKSLNITTCGAACDGSTDDTAAINCALDAVGDTAGGGEVIIPAGTCIISPSRCSPPNALNFNLLHCPNPPPAPNPPTCGLQGNYLHLYNNLLIRGSGPKSVLKVSDSHGDYSGIFVAVSSPLTNVVFKDFKVDQNPNPPNPPSVYIPCYPQTVIGPDVSTTGITVSGMFFDPTDGAWAIHAEGDQATADLRATITNNYFNFVNATGGFASYDNSTVYLEGAPEVVTGAGRLNQLTCAARVSGAERRPRGRDERQRCAHRLYCRRFWCYARPV